MNSNVLKQIISLASLKDSKGITGWITPNKITITNFEQNINAKVETPTNKIFNEREIKQIEDLGGKLVIGWWEMKQFLKVLDGVNEYNCDIVLSNLPTYNGWSVIGNLKLSLENGLTYKTEQSNPKSTDKIGEPLSNVGTTANWIPLLKDFTLYLNKIEPTYKGRDQLVKIHTKGDTIFMKVCEREIEIPIAKGVLDKEYTYNRNDIRQGGQINFNGNKLEIKNGLVIHSINPHRTKVEEAKKPSAADMLKNSIFSI